MNLYNSDQKYEFRSDFTTFEENDFHISLNEYNL